MDERAEGGDILSKRNVAISDNDDAASLYGKLGLVAAEQVVESIIALANGTYARTPQDDSLANVWRKRSKEDGKIDWRMTARGA